MPEFDHLFEAKPMPTREEYEQAYIHFDKELDTNGGAWVDVMRRVLDQPPHSNRLQRFEYINNVARSLRTFEWPIGENDIEEYQASTPVSSAFFRGFLQQIAPLQYIHSEKLDENSAQESLQRFYHDQDVYNFRTLQQSFDFDNTFINAVGEYGQSKLNKTSTDILEKWSDEVYPHDDTLSYAFRLGHGVMIVVGEQYQRYENNDFLNLEIQRIDFNEVAHKMLTNGTGEEQ